MLRMFHTCKITTLNQNIYFTIIKPAEDELQIHPEKILLTARITEIIIP